MNKAEKTLLDNYIYVVSYLIHWGELWKAYGVLRNAPVSLEDNKDVRDLIINVSKKLDEISNMQNYGQDGINVRTGFIDPENAGKLVKFQILKKLIKKLKLKKLVDVGCYTGWLGRNLAAEGIEVHGIDTHPVIIYVANKLASGTLATFERLTAQELGYVHPHTYEGAILFDVLEHCFDTEITIRSVEKSLKKGGWMFICLPNPEAEEKSPLAPLELHEHLHAFTKKKLEKIFGKKKDLKIDRVINEDKCPMWFISYQI